MFCQGLGRLSQLVLWLSPTIQWSSRELHFTLLSLLLVPSCLWIEDLLLTVRVSILAWTGFEVGFKTVNVSILWMSGGKELQRRGGIATEGSGPLGVCECQRAADGRWWAERLIYNAVVVTQVLAHLRLCASQVFLFERQKTSRSPLICWATIIKDNKLEGDRNKIHFLSWQVTLSS